MEDLHIVFQVICVYTSASNPNSSYGVKIWGYIDFSRVWGESEIFDTQAHPKYEKPDLKPTFATRLLHHDCT